MNRHAVDRFQQRQLDEILPPDEAADRRRRRDHQQRVAGVRIDQPMQQAGPGKRHGDVGQRRIGNVSDHHQRLRRRLHGVGEGQRPVRDARLIVGLQRRHLRAIEANADRLALLERQQADLGDQRPALGADRLDVDRLQGVEHQPHRIGPAKQRRRRGGGERKRQAQSVAVACRADLDGRFAGPDFRRRGCPGVRRRIGRGGNQLWRGVYHGRRHLICRHLLGPWRRLRCFRRRGRLRRRLGLDLDPGLLRERFRRRRRNLAGRPRQRRCLCRLLGPSPRSRRDRRGSARGIRRRRRQRRGLVRLLETNVDDVVLLLAEGVRTSTSPISPTSIAEASPSISCPIDAMFGGAATLASARSKDSAALNDSVSFCSFSTLETPTPSGISNTKRTKVGCTEARTRIGGRFLASLAARCWRRARSATRARSDNSRTTSGGRPGGGPLQPSGNMSTNSRSPAVMVLMVTLRASDSRIAEPSGSRRADET